MIFHRFEQAEKREGGRWSIQEYRLFVYNKLKLKTLTAHYSILAIFHYSTKRLPLQKFPRQQNRMVVKKIFFLLIFTSISHLLSAQMKGWEVGPWGGVSYYFGDLNTNFDLSHPGMSFGFVGRYNFNDRLCLKLSGNYGQVSADDANSSNPFERARNLSFESAILDGAMQFEFNFLPYTHGDRDYFYTPYLFAGINVFNFNPQADLDGKVYDLRAYGTEGQFKGEEYYSLSAGLLYGFGFKIDLNFEWSLNFELGARYLFTDYLDDVSTVYPDKSDLLKDHGEIAVRLSDRSIPVPGEPNNLGEQGYQRGNSRINDSYVMIGVGLLYYFGDIRCPDYGSRRKF